MEGCRRLQDKSRRCPCTYASCGRKGICCECLAYHLAQRQAPACFFSKEDEATFDRSLDFFVSSYQKRVR